MFMFCRLFSFRACDCPVAGVGNCGDLSHWTWNLYLFSTQEVLSRTENGRIVYKEILRVRKTGTCSIDGLNSLTSRIF